MDHGLCAKIRRQLVGIGSLLLPREISGTELRLLGLAVQVCILSLFYFSTFVCPRTIFFLNYCHFTCLLMAVGISVGITGFSCLGEGAGELSKYR